MKLRNKRTGDIFELNEFCLYDDKGFAKRPFLKSLAELNEEWEDYEDDDLSKIIEYIDKGLEDEILPVSVNDFVEKLKAWKRLKGVGFKFTDWYRDVCEVSIQAEIHDEGTMGVINDLDLLFGGEE